MVFDRIFFVSVFVSLLLLIIGDLFGVLGVFDFGDPALVSGILLLSWFGAFFG